ncbi:hypothetical protein Pan153_34000 [Gimesia panareensis]|uniref:Uncharacterized protein n=1 Tax=Gimesia panareensis TaxID=2527978 RepID=A0A518FQW6_9PLAN|nr:hypothetical protein [Gimesia panareensis]QDV18739.1 hypothetical protein Pan153_34000 [Gimesia panareensis]
MGEHSAYYVPEDQESVIGKSDEIRMRFWDLGVFLDCMDEPIASRLAEARKTGVSLPEWKHDFGFGGMGIQESEVDLPVPELPYDAQCPHCGAEVFRDLADTWYGSEEIDESPDLAAAITCSSCQKQFSVDEMKCPEQGFAHARWYLWVSDIDPDDYDRSFKQTIEAIVGPCKEVFGWDT